MEKIFKTERELSIYPTLRSSIHHESNIYIPDEDNLYKILLHGNRLTREGTVERLSLYSNPDCVLPNGIIYTPQFEFLGFRMPYLKDYVPSTKLIFSKKTSYKNKLKFARKIAIAIEELSKNLNKNGGYIPGIRPGVETENYIKGIIDEVKPNLVILIDALCSSSIKRVNKSIQITDTGVSPGSGIGNKRKELSRETLGIPVIAIGVPTVLDASTIVSDTINYMIKNYAYNKKHINSKSSKFINKPVNYLKENSNLSLDDRKKLLGLIGSLNNDEIKLLIKEVLSPIGYNLIVTPKEVDFEIDKLSEVISYGINHSLNNI